MLWLRSGIQKSKTVKLSQNPLTRCGVSRYAKRRGLFALEKAGLISMVKNKGKSPTITIVDIEGADPQETTTNCEVIP